MKGKRDHDLYRFYDADDRLLYIGISLNAATRASAHRRDKSWWSDVDRMEVQHLGAVTRQQAEAIERDAIKKEGPLHNVKHNDVAPVAGGELVWLCELCGEPIDDGYVEVPARERRRFLLEMDAWRTEYPHVDDDGFTACEVGPAGMREADWDALFARPDEAHWWAIHRRCDPEPDGGGYHFTIDRIQTPYDVLKWTCHLLGKVWVDRETDWMDLVKSISPGRPISTYRHDSEAP